VLDVRHNDLHIMRRKGGLAVPNLQGSVWATESAGETLKEWQE
jgi:hypothetical protein